MADQEKAATTPTVTPLDGKTTLNDKMFFEPERLAYASTAGIALTIATEVTSRLKGRPVIITAGELLTDLSNLRAAEALLAGVIEQYRTCRRLGDAMNKQVAGTESASLMGALGPAVAVLQGALGLISLFRENVEFSGVKTEIDQLTFRIVLAAQLKKQGVDVRLYDTQSPSPNPSTPSKFLESLAEAESVRAAAWEALAPHLAALAEAQAKLDAAARVQNNAAAVEQAAKELTARRQKITPVTNLLERADAQLASLRGHLEKVDDKTSLMTLGKLLRAEMARDDNAWVLHVGVVAAGGHYRVSQSLWSRRADVGAMGGTVVRWALLEGDGAFEAGGLQHGQLSEKFPDP